MSRILSVGRMRAVCIPPCSCMHLKRPGPGSASRMLEPDRVSLMGFQGPAPCAGARGFLTSARPRALVLLDTYTLLVTRRAGRWLRKMRDGRQLVLPIGARRLIARPTVSRLGAGCPCWGLGQSPFWVAIPLVAFCQLARVSRSLARAGAAGGFSALLLRPFWAALPISPGRRRSRPEGSP